jgi:hypothetical protein
MTFASAVDGSGWSGFPSINCAAFARSDQLRSFREVSDGLVELAHRDVAVAAVPVEPGIVRERRDPLGEEINRLAHVTGDRLLAPEPEERVGAVRRAGQRVARRSQPRVGGLPRFGCECDRVERFAEQGHRLGFRGHSLLGRLGLRRTRQERARQDEEAHRDRSTA